MFAAGISLRASEHARANALMKPSLISCCFSMSSLHRLRISINDDMSISLNVVRNAAVFCDSFNHSAMRSRILFIFTRFSFCEGSLPAAKVVSAEGDVDCLLSSFGAGLLVSFTSALLLPCDGVGSGGGTCLWESAFDSTASPFSERQSRASGSGSSSPLHRKKLVEN